MKPLALLHIVFVICACLVACNDDDPITPNNTNTQEQLPPITTIGAGTFGCKVNGKVWLAKSNKTGWPPTYASVDKNNDLLINISGDMVVEPNFFHMIGIQFYYIEKKTNYLLNILKDSFPNANYIDMNHNQFWRTSSIVGGAVNILRFDTTIQILSGTFYFDCVNKATGEILKVTDGRFDMHYTY